MATLFKILLICALVCVITGDNVTNSPEKSQVIDKLLEKALNDERFLKYQIQCALNKGSCDILGKRLKQMVPQALIRGNCAGCSPEDTNLMRKLIVHIQQKFPKEWRALITTFMG